MAVDTIQNAGVDTSVGDGLVWRLVSWFVMTTTAILFVMWYSVENQGLLKSFVF
nr:hypothetical protein [Entomoplasma sp. MP1]